MHDKTLTFRLPTALHAQLEQIATAQYLKMGELVRNLIKDEIKRAQPYVGAQNSAPQQPTKTKSANPIWDAMSPAERKAYNEEWDY